jgi:[acyl-carrier-protein] S-malonyltransferase
MAIAFIFPGQGSQSVGMMKGLADHFPIVQKTFAEAANALDTDLWALVTQGPEEKLNKTDITQPAMLAAGVATYRVWQELGGPAPSYMAGHSLGEYTALVCAGAIPFADGIRLVADRGRFMQEAVPAGIGAMAAVLGLDDAVIVELCAANAKGEVVQAVNFNSPGQVVVAGHAAAVARVVEAAKAAGAKRSVLLPVSAPSHCELMRPAAEKLKARLQDINVTRPAVPVIHNADVASYDDPARIKDALVRQLHSPVRWVESVQHLAQQGATQMAECGPGKVLAGLIKRIDKSVSIVALVDQENMQLALTSFK